jgi:hypothetical protein
MVHSPLADPESKFSSDIMQIKEHHRRSTFEDEFRMLCRKNNVEMTKGMLEMMVYRALFQGNGIELVSQG